MLTAVVVAGGRSTRFGEADKAVAGLAGVPMVRRVADRLVEAVDAVIVNCRGDQRDAIADALADYPLPVAFAVDPAPDEGPMAGIRTGLRAVETEYAFVCACDMPFLDHRVVDLLAERARGHDAAVPKLDDGWYQTTHTVYRAETMADACDRALARDDHKILAPLEDLDWVVVDEESVRARGSVETFENLNTREEFEQAAEHFAE
ncbi:molybdenum cofactor guanylyltransferase [Halomarina oriensis]|uniref:Probable molybdenum cofactor guanylyltransferase n=1 Tax=Halomarina oriensis TaxID=671145 RepID=A0A6B0GL42_9EURY|nr:molybdenum cofactor guanylyltransferase [Halomarina oriensis]MWG35350.1 NTP transferase domain-containing protein [Halomarina oriensis]